MLSLAVHWFNNNERHVQRLQFQHHMYKLATDKALWLQQSIASLIDEKPEKFKVLLDYHSLRLTLTPALQALCTAHPSSKHFVVEQFRKAWAELQAASDKVANVHVMPLSFNDVCIDEKVQKLTVVKSLQLQWVGSNKIICEKLEYFQCEHPDNLEWPKACWLQHSVAQLIGANRKHVKVLLGSPSGPQLTPALHTLSMTGPAPKTSIQQARITLAQAWTAVETAQSDVLKLYVTQHSAADVAISKLVWSSNDKYLDVSEVYNNMSDELRSNPKVARVALRMIELARNNSKTSKT